MLHDIDHVGDKSSRFFRARLEDGVLDIGRRMAEGVVA
jgi:CRISPR-associated protein Cas5d